MERRFVAVLLLPGLFSLMPLHSSYAAKSTSPQSVALRLADLPRGFHQGSSRSYTVAEAAHLDHVSVSTFRRHGRLLSYRRVFLRSVRQGVFDVENFVASFKSSRGAHWDYRRVVNDARRSYVQQGGFREVRIPKVGSERTASSFNGQFLNVVIIRFHRARYRVTLKVVGLASHVQPRETLKIATRLGKIVDKRIRRA